MGTWVFGALGSTTWGHRDMRLLFFCKKFNFRLLLFKAFFSVLLAVFNLKVNLFPHSRNPLNAEPLYMVLHQDSISVSYNSFIVDRNSIVVDRRPQAPGGGVSCRTNLGFVFQNSCATCFKKKLKRIFSKWKKPNMCAIEIFNRSHIINQLKGHLVTSCIVG